MTQVFAPDGTVTPATVIKAGPCVVVQAKGAGDRRLRGRAARARRGASGARAEAAGRALQEGRRAADARAPRGEARGQGRRAAEGGRPGARQRRVRRRRSRGRHRRSAAARASRASCKRHNFRGGAATHGSMFHRAPGSIGASSFPSRVVKGMRAGGRMGGDRVTVRNLKVVQVDAREQPARAARRGAGRAGRLRRHPQGDHGEEDRRAAAREAVEGGRRRRRSDG